MTAFAPVSVWVLWILIAYGLTFTPYATLFRVFLTHSPAPVAAVLPALPFAFATGAWLTHRFRVPRWEPIILLGLPALLCLAKAPLPTVLAVVFFLSAHAIGVRCLPAPPPSPLLRVGLRFGIGLSVISILLVLAGLAGLLRWPIALIILGPAVFSGELWADLKCLRTKWTESEDNRHPAVSVLLFFALAMALLGGLWAITPSIAFDTLKMHLAYARWYAETGAFSPVPLSPESYYPQGAELIMAFFWLVGGQAAAQMFAPVSLVATLLVLAGILRKCGLKPAVVFCGLVAGMSLPFLHWTAFVAKNDLALAFFLVASLASLLEKRIYLATFFLAMAFGIKHVAFFGAVALAPIFVHLIWQSAKNQVGRSSRLLTRLRTLGAVCAIFLGLGTFSLVRAYVHTGNPLYPEVASRTTDFSVVNHPYPTNADRVMRYVGVPWLLHFNGQGGFESSSPNPMGFWLVFFALSWLTMSPPPAPAFRQVLLFCGIYLLYWVSILVTLRYAIVPIFLITALSAPALFRLPRWLVIPASVYCCFFSLAVCVLIEVSPPQLLWWAGRLSGDGFLRQMLPGYAAAQALHGRAERTDRIFALDACPVPYTPYPGSLRCFFPNDIHNSAVELRGEIFRDHYRFLILPPTPLREQLLASLPTTVLYADASFSLYEVGTVPNVR